LLTLKKILRPGLLTKDEARRMAASLLHGKQHYMLPRVVPEEGQDALPEDSTLPHRNKLAMPFAFQPWNGTPR
jgi:hypothetical protein